MTRKIFQSMIAVVVSVLLLSLALITGVLYEHFESAMLDQMRTTASFVEQGVKEDGMKYLDEMSSSQCRITWIEADGTVKFDNRSDPSTMENHADRAEVKEALENESGTSIRRSSTLSEHTLYYAKRMQDGTVLRLSAIRVTTGVLVLNMLQPILLVLAAAACWGLENNCTRNISDKSTFEIVFLKGIFSGLGSFLIALCIGEPFPGLHTAAAALLLGFVAYGLSIFCYVRSQNTLGAAKTSAYYAIAPFIGTALSCIIWHDALTVQYFLALAVMLLGSVLVVLDTLQMEHTHSHTHTFTHTHDGVTHTHTITHSHAHVHGGSETEHSHHHRMHTLLKQHEQAALMHLKSWLMTAITLELA